MASEILSGHLCDPNGQISSDPAAANHTRRASSRTKTAAQLSASPYAEIIEQRGPFIPVPSWNQRHAWPPIGGLRHLIFHASSNGFDQVIRRVGRRVLIDETAFFAWVDSNGGAK